MEGIYQLIMDTQEIESFANRNFNEYWTLKYAQF